MGLENLLQLITKPTLTASIGNQISTPITLSCVPNTFTKIVWNYQSNGSGDTLKMWTNQADVVYLDSVSVTQAYDGWRLRGG